MPKVESEYFERKKNKIVEAGIKVCMEKPVYNITMKDIVIESGFSQGGVYKYFSNIDDLFLHIINKINRDINIKDEIETILHSDKAPEYILGNIFRIAGRVMKDTLISNGKIYFELVTFYVNYPERYEKISKRITTKHIFDYLIGVISSFILEKIEAGYFKPIVPFKDIISFAIASFDGIVRDVILSKCYKKNSQELIEFDEIALINSLYISTLALLRGDIEKGINI